MLRLAFAVFTTFLSVISSEAAPNEAINVAISDKFSVLDTLSSVSSDSSADRIRSLMFNSLVKKNDRFEYVGDLAKEIKIDYKKLTITFILTENVKFHNGKTLTADDAKYTLNSLFSVGGYKGSSFFTSKPNIKKNERIPTRENHIISIEVPNEKTLVMKIRNVELINQTLSNLVAIPIIPEGTIEQQKTSPIGTGAFKFVKFEPENNLVEFDANQDYWEGSPEIKKIIVKTVLDFNILVAELKAGTVDIAINPPNISADNFRDISKHPNIQIVQKQGSNIRYIGFNLKSKSINKLKLRQAIAYGIDREKLVTGLVLGRAKVAHSILPEQSWAYSADIKYEYSQIKAKKLLKVSGYKGELIKFNIASGNIVVAEYAEGIGQMLKEIGINIEVEKLESNTLIEKLRSGQFQMNTSVWVGGNQDPIFLRDLFETTESPDSKSSGRNRSRYSNSEFDKIIEKAINSTNKYKAKEAYKTAQEIVARDLPLLPLFYPANTVFASKRIGDININCVDDWDFLKDVKLRAIKN